MFHFVIRSLQVFSIRNITLPVREFIFWLSGILLLLAFIAALMIFSMRHTAGPSVFQLNPSQERVQPVVGNPGEPVMAEAMPPSAKKERAVAAVTFVQYNY